MPKWLPKSCRRCHVHVDDGAVISRRGFCYPCGELRNELAQRMNGALGRGDYDAAQEYMRQLGESLPPPRVGGTPSHSRKGSMTKPKADSA